VIYLKDATVYIGEKCLPSTFYWLKMIYILMALE